MLNISTQQAGTLQEQLSEADWKKLKAIKISGILNECDIEWLNNVLSLNKGLYVLDLFQANISPSSIFPCFFERGMNSFSIPDGIKELKKDTLKCLSISTLNIPSSVFYIEKGAFSSCPELKVINVSEQNLKFKSIGGVLYTKNESELIFCPPKREGSIVVKEGVIRIAPKAFSKCDKLNTLILPNSLKLENSGSLIQDFKSKKTEVHWKVEGDRYNYSETIYAEKGRVLERHSPDEEDYKEGDPHYDVLKKSEYDFFVPNGVEEISEGAFQDCYQLRSIKLPSSIITLRKNAFLNCSHLCYIEIPNKLKEIDESCFYGCRNLGKICCWASTPPKCKGEIIDYTHDKILYVPKGTMEKYKKAKGWKNFKNIREVEAITYLSMRMSNGEKNTISFSPSIVKNDLKDYISNIWQNISKITIKGKIGANDIFFFKRMCTEGELTDIDLTDCKIQEMPEKAFCDANKLASINLPDSLETVPDSFLLGCKKLKRITIGINTKEIGCFAFADCTSLKHIDFTGATTKLKRGVCWNCTSLESLSLGNEIKEIGEDAFRGCDSIKRIDCLAQTPPFCHPDSFSKETYNNADLTIPSVGYNMFQQNIVWSSFVRKTAENILF